MTHSEAWPDLTDDVSKGSGADAMLDRPVALDEAWPGERTR